MLRKANVLTQIKKSVSNSVIKSRESNRRVLKKCFNTIYFMTKEKWAQRKILRML